MQYTYTTTPDQDAALTYEATNSNTNAELVFAAMVNNAMNDKVSNSKGAILNQLQALPLDTLQQIVVTNT